MQHRPKLSRLTLAVLTSLASALTVEHALSQKAVPLAELTKLNDETEIGTHRHVIRLREKPVATAWTESRYRKAQLDGKPVYVVHTRGEIVNPITASFRSLASSAVYDAELGLIALANLAESKRKPIVETFRWADGKLLLTRGKSKKAREIQAAARPLLDDMLMLEKGRLAKGAKRQCHKLDPLKRRVHAIEIEHVGGDDWTLDKQPVDKFRSSEQGGMTTYVSPEARAILQSEFDKQPLLVLKSDATPAALSAMLMANDALAKPVTAKIRAGWKSQKARWTNKVIGAEMRFPERWNARKGARGFMVLTAQSDDKLGYVGLIVERHTPYFDLERYTDLLIGTLSKDMSPPGKHTRTKTRVGSHKAVELAYERQAGKKRYTMRLDVFVNGGYAYRLLRIHIKGDTNWTKDLDAIRKSFKVRKR